MMNIIKRLLIALILFADAEMSSQSREEKMVNEAIGLRGLGKMDEAIAILEKCLNKYPDYDLALFVRGNWTVISKQYSTALPYLERLEKVNSNFNPLQKRMLAESYFNTRDFSNATKYVQEFLKK